jgi:hypothetical protein
MNSVDKIFLGVPLNIELIGMVIIFVAIAVIVIKVM